MAEENKNEQDFQTFLEAQKFENVIYGGIDLVANHVKGDPFEKEENCKAEFTARTYDAVYTFKKLLGFYPPNKNGVVKITVRATGAAAVHLLQYARRHSSFRGVFFGFFTTEPYNHEGNDGTSLSDRVILNLTNFDDYKNPMPRKSRFFSQPSSSPSVEPSNDEVEDSSSPFPPGITVSKQ